MDNVIAVRQAAYRVADLPVAVVIPLFNEEAIVTQKLEEIAEVFDSFIGEEHWFFVLVENGSMDKTPQLVEEATRRWPQSYAVTLTEPNYGAALKAGLRSVKRKWAYTLDIEQWDAPFIAWSWKHRQSYELFIGSKRGDPTLNDQAPYRRLLSCGLNGVLQVLMQFSGTDTHGCKLIDCDSLRSIIDACQLDRGQFDTEMVLRAVRARKRIVELPVEYREYRPMRNWMIKKIVWNLRAVRRLTRVMAEVPFEGSIRYYRFAREDLLAEAKAADPATAKEFGVV
jgi:glycosyltransferase involved in cell wall biosynthesis